MSMTIQRQKVQPDRTAPLFAALIVLVLLTGMFTGYYIGILKPRLVGIDCVGASAPLYAEEESDFPMCRKIKRRNPLNG